ncbi:S1C family serine protease [Peribacillus sp. SCS-155]|uniref:S1C family serine protease n=1 Tax=Peribacillus sedimenti TaxID=3115297 RepID=UPI003906162E
MNLNENETTYNEKPQKRRTFPIMFASLSGAALGTMITLYSTNMIDIDKNGITVVNQANTITKANVSANKSSENSIAVQETASTTESTPSSMLNAINDVSDAVVGVVNMQDQETGYYSSNETSQGNVQDSGTGSGVIFKKSADKAYIATNNHVIEGAVKVEVSLSNGKRIEAKIVGADALTDLAVLQIDSKYVNKVASFGDSSKIKLGQQVAAIGNPLGLDFSGSVTQGIVSGKQRTISVSTSQGDWDLNVIQTDAAINPGNSGGALINESGQVIGINSLKIAESGVEGLGFAIPSQDAVPIIEDLMQKGKVERPYLGVGLQNISEISPSIRAQQLNLPDSMSEGVIISHVEPSSAASQAGLEVKDVILSIDGTKADTVGEFRKYLYTKTSIGKDTKLRIYRNGEEKTITLKLSEQGA